MPKKLTHTPERTCIICFAKKAPTELIAITRLKSGEIVINSGHNFAGRSAYICRKRACLEQARKEKKRKVFAYHLKKPFPEEFWSELEKLVD